VEAEGLYQRERQAFGGTIQWEASFFGWLAAVGFAALAVAMVIGAGVAVGLTQLGDSAKTQVDELTTAGGVILIAVLALAYVAGGYVAARMGRFDGWRQGLGVWLLSLLMTLALAAAAWIARGNVNPLESLSLPRIPVDEGPLTEGGAIATGVIALVSLAGAIGGGILGERFHRAVDRAAVEPIPESPEPESPEEPPESPRDTPAATPSRRADAAEPVH